MHVGTFATVSNLMQHFFQIGLTWAHVTNSYQVRFSLRQSFLYLARHKESTILQCYLYTGSIKITCGVKQHTTVLASRMDEHLEMARQNRQGPGSLLLIIQFQKYVKKCKGLTIKVKLRVLSPLNLPNGFTRLPNNGSNQSD